MKQRKWIVLSTLLMVTLTGCASGTASDQLEKDAEVINLTSADFSEQKLADEEKANQYAEYLVASCQEALEKEEGIAQIEIDIDDTKETLTLNVEVVFEKSVEDKNAIKESIEITLKGFFTELEDIVINISEKESK